MQLLICYTGIYILEAVHHQPLLNAFFRDGMNCTLLAFTLNTCAYTTEIIAGSIKATAYGEIEAALAFGMSRFTLYRRIVLPSALRRALPWKESAVCCSRERHFHVDPARLPSIASSPSVHAPPAWT